VKKTGQVKRTSWQKGESGNPGGRPKVAAEVMELRGTMVPKRLTGW
jgi:hypothetical protein